MPDNIPDVCKERRSCAIHRRDVTRSAILVHICLSSPICSFIAGVGATIWHSLGKIVCKSHIILKSSIQFLYRKSCLKTEAQPWCDPSNFAYGAQQGRCQFSEPDICQILSSFLMESEHIYIQREQAREDFSNETRDKLVSMPKRCESISEGDEGFWSCRWLLPKLVSWTASETLQVLGREKVKYASVYKAIGQNTMSHVS